MPETTDTIFSKIIRGEVPSHKVYEDQHCIVILDIAPLSEGHALVIPKEPARSMDELSDDAAAGVGRVMPRVCRALKKVTGCEAYNVLQNNGEAAGQSVHHVHFHIIPRFADRGAPISGKPDQHNGPGLQMQWHPGTLTPEAAKEIGMQVKRLL
ncbi:MAG: HIT family protein [Planctomycetota bacterium]